MDFSTPGFPVRHQLPRAYSNSCPLSPWCHPTISSSVIPFSAHLQSFPTSGSFHVCQFFTSGSQSIGTSASVLPVNIQDWFSLGWTGWVSFLSKGLSRVFPNTTGHHWHTYFHNTLKLPWNNISDNFSSPRNLKYSLLWRIRPGANKFSVSFFCVLIIIVTFLL